MIQVEITDKGVVDRPITAKTGKQFIFREQTAWAHLVGPNGAKDPHPSKFVINLDRDVLPYEPGRYTISPESVYVNKYGSLEIGRLRLKAIAVTAARAA